MFIGVLAALNIYKYLHIGLPCPFHLVTGLYCPGCGITRTLLSLIELNFYQAFRYNMLVTILIGLYIVYKFLCLIKYIITKDYRINIPNYIYIMLIVITIAFGILRNIPQFSFLAPTVV